MSSQGELHSAPEGGGAALFQEVAVGHLEAVVLAVVGDGAHTDGLTQLHELLGDLPDGMDGFTQSAANSSGRERVVSACDVYLLQIAEKSI